MYEPTTPELLAVRSRISDDSWIKRVEEARKAEPVVRRILGLIEAENISQNEAIRRLLPSAKRSWALVQLKRYREAGFEGLISRKTPREPRLTREVGPIIQGLREANPRITVEQAWKELAKNGMEKLPSSATMKREFRKVDDRRRYSEKKQRAEKPEVTELSYAGGQVLLAAEAETGIIEAMTETVTAHAEQAKEASAGEAYLGDVEHRDRKGRFTTTYNRKRRRRRGQAVADYLRPAEAKAEGRPADWARFTQENKKTLGYKNAMLVFMWMLVRGKGWDALREPGTEASAELTGFAYMPSTMAKYTSALAISGLGDALLETIGKRWDEVASACWKESSALSAIYVDNQVKEVWTSLFTKAGKVSHISRVMPCITTTYAHTGAGTPVVMGVHSGSAPLAPDLLSTVKEVERTLQTEVERVTVIDAEGSTFDVLAAFSRADRAIVTPLKPARLRELELRYEPGSYYRPFRERDQIRVAKGTLTRKRTQESLEIGVLLIRREKREQETILLTTGMEMGMKGRDLADLYFKRWPMQENTFKDWRAVGLGEHRGNCGRMVANMAVVTELEKLSARRGKMVGKLEALTKEAAELEGTRLALAHEADKAQAALDVRRRRLDAMVESGKTSGARFGAVAADHHRALSANEKLAAELHRVGSKATTTSAKRDVLARKLDDLEAKQRKLEPLRKIREVDVAQDKILTANKLAAAGLITYALREYFHDTPMTPATIVDRLLGMKGRREVTAETEHVVIYTNPRDPEMSNRVAAACERINMRKIVRLGRRLTYAVEERGTPADEYGWLG